MTQRALTTTELFAGDDGPYKVIVEGEGATSRIYGICVDGIAWHPNEWNAREAARTLFRRIRRWWR